MARSSTDAVSSTLSYEEEELSPEDLRLRTNYGGMKFPPAVRVETLRAVQTFEIRHDDTFVVTYPKSGTHWMAEIVGLLQVDGDTDRVDRFSTIAHIEFSIFDKTASNIHGKIKQCLMYKMLNEAKSPRLISSHLRTRFLPQQIFEKNTKIIYVARNPKDVFTSFYHFNKSDPVFGHVPWEEYFKAAVTGDFVFGSWFDHVLEFWKLRDQENILFLKYEDMKKDPRQAIESVAKHLGLSPSEEVVDKIVRLSSIQEMKKTFKRLETAATHRFGQHYGKSYGANTYVRKGIVGDWKTHFSVAQNEEFDRVYTQKMTNTGLTFDVE